MFPGSNMLEEAMELIDSIEIQWEKNTGRSLNGVGIYTNTYAAPETVNAIVQAVSFEVYQQLGLDWQQKYLMVYMSRDVTTAERDSAGDRVVIFGKKYQVVSELPWAKIDGWDGFLALELKEGS